jgi:hypothetical protein
LDLSIESTYGLVQSILDLTNVSNYWIEAIDGGKA